MAQIPVTSITLLKDLARGNWLGQVFDSRKDHAPSVVNDGQATIPLRSIDDIRHEEMEVHATGRSAEDDVTKLGRRGDERSRIRLEQANGS